MGVASLEMRSRLRGARPPLVVVLHHRLRSPAAAVSKLLGATLLLPRDSCQQQRASRREASPPCFACNAWMAVAETCLRRLPLAAVTAGPRPSALLRLFLLCPEAAAAVRRRRLVPLWDTRWGPAGKCTAGDRSRPRLLLCGQPPARARPVGAGPVGERLWLRGRCPCPTQGQPAVRFSGAASAPV